MGSFTSSTANQIELEQPELEVEVLGITASQCQGSETANNPHTQSKRKMKAARKKKDEKASAAAALQPKLVRTDKSLSELYLIVASLQSQMTTQGNDFKKTLDRMDGRITSQGFTIKSQGGKISTQDSTIKSQDDRITTLKKAIEDQEEKLSCRISELQALINDHEHAITNLRNNGKLHTDKIALLESSVATLNDEISYYKGVSSFAELINAYYKVLFDEVKNTELHEYNNNVDSWNYFQCFNNASDVWSKYIWVAQRGLCNYESFDQYIYGYVEGRFAAEHQRYQNIINYNDALEDIRVMGNIRKMRNSTFQEAFSDPDEALRLTSSIHFSKKYLEINEKEFNPANYTRIVGTLRNFLGK